MPGGVTLVTVRAAFKPEDPVACARDSHRDVINTVLGAVIGAVRAASPPEAEGAIAVGFAPNHFTPTGHSGERWALMQLAVDKGSHAERTVLEASRTGAAIPLPEGGVLGPWRFTRIRVMPGAGGEVRCVVRGLPHGFKHRLEETRALLEAELRLAHPDLSVLALQQSSERARTWGQQPVRASRAGLVTLRLPQRGAGGATARPFDLRKLDCQLIMADSTLTLQFQPLPAEFGAGPPSDPAPVPAAPAGGCPPPSSMPPAPLVPTPAPPPVPAGGLDAAAEQRVRQMRSWTEEVMRAGGRPVPYTGPPECLAPSMPPRGPMGPLMPGPPGGLAAAEQMLYWMQTWVEMQRGQTAMPAGVAGAGPAAPTPPQSSAMAVGRGAADPSPAAGPPATATPATALLASPVHAQGAPAAPALAPAPDQALARAARSGRKAPRTATGPAVTPAPPASAGPLGGAGPGGAAAVGGASPVPRALLALTWPSRGEARRRSSGGEAGLGAADGGLALALVVRQPSPGRSPEELARLGFGPGGLRDMGLGPAPGPAERAGRPTKAPRLEGLCPSGGARAPAVAAAEGEGGVTPRHA